MTDPVHELDERGRSAAAGLRRAVALQPPELSDLVRASRVRKVGQAAFGVAVLVALGAIAFGAASVTSPDALRWATAAILVVLLASTWLLCAHAGGHAFFVPLPALALAVLWALTVSGHGDAAWWLVAMSAAAAGGGVLVGSTALRQRLRAVPVPVRVTPGTSGIAVTALTPIGVVQVASETWTAESSSGTVPAGAPVHVVSVRGVRLVVWSEDGTVPDQRMFTMQEEEP